MSTNEIKQQLANGGRIYGCAIVSASPHWPLILKYAGMDFVFLDTEHITLGRETLARMCQIYQALGIAPFVRIPSPDPYQACMVLDGGASGVIAPYLETVEEVRALVGAVKLRPLKGQKLREVLTGRAVLSERLHQYIVQRNQSNLLFINIESTQGLENLDAMLQVDGWDGIFIGPHDLSCSLEVPEQYDHPLFIKSVEIIIKKSLAHQKPVAIHFPGEPSNQIKYAKMGANIILHSADMFMFQRALLKEFSEIKSALGDEIFGRNQYNSVV